MNHACVCGLALVNQTEKMPKLAAHSILWSDQLLLGYSMDLMDQLSGSL
jgi:hypothetical protein